MKCIDLERRFPQYKLGYEDPAFQGTRDPWHKIIECRSGHICPAGGDFLWACTNSTRSHAAQSLRRGETPARLINDGQDGVNAEFHVKDWKVMFLLMGAKRR